MARIVERQVGRVRRRLFLAALLSALAWAWAGALALAAVWFAIQPLLVADAPDSLRWAVAASLAVGGTVLAVALAVRSAPTAVAAALSLDDRFGLKERATTALTLPDDLAATPMGRALLVDAEAKLAGLRVGERFPVRLPRAAALVAAGALALVLLAMFWNPRFGGRAAADELPLPEARAGIEEQMKKLAARPPMKQEAAKAKKEDIERIDADVEKFTRQPRGTREEVRERIKDAQAIEDDIRKQQREQAERAEAIKEQLKQQERLRRKDGEARKGPADPLAEAIRRGDMEKAAQEMKRLAEKLAAEEKKEGLKKKIRDPKADEEEKRKAEDELKRLERRQPMDEKEREGLQTKMEEMEDRLKELTRRKEDRKNDLDKRDDLGRDQLDREKNELDKNADKLSDEQKKDLLEIAKKLGECQQCMKEGDDLGAAKKLQEAGEMAAKMAGKDGGEELAERLKEIQEARKALCRGLGGEGPGAGLRPLGADKGDTGKEEKFSPAPTGKGKLEIAGDGPKGGLKGARRPEELAQEIRQAAQEPPSAIDRQRLPPGARKMARGYFEQERAQDKDGKKP